MSVVVAVKNGDHVLVGCDSQMTYGYTKEILTNQRKMWKPTDNKNIVMGLVGTVRDANILSVAEEWIDELTELKNDFNLKYVIKTIVPKMFRELEDNGRLRIKDGIKSIDSIVTFAYRDMAYSIDFDGAVVEMEDILVNGSGYSLCLGAWDSIKDENIPVQEKLIRVIKAACEKNLFINYPIIIMNTKNNNVDIIE